MSYAACASETWTLCGDCASSLSLTQVALRSYEAALAHDPSNVKALCGISAGLRSIDISRNDTVGSQNAIETLTRALFAYPHLTKVANIFRNLAECYLLIGLNDKAHQSVQKALELSPKSPTLWLLNAQTLIRFNARQQATLALTHCLMLISNKNSSQDNDDIKTARVAHAELASIAAADGKIDASIAELTASLELPPPPLAQTEEYVSLWCALASAKKRAHNLEGAIQVCEAAERAAGRSPRILLIHAYLLLVREGSQPDVAIKLLHEVVGDDANHNVIEVSTKNEKNEKFENENDQFFSQNGSQKSFRRNFAKPLKHQNLEKWSSDDFLPYFLLGQAYSLLDHPRAACDAYRAALCRATNSPIAWLAVGKLCLKLKQLPDAFAAYSQALRFRMDDGSAVAAVAWDGLSCVYERSNFQLADAAVACDRCAACYRAIGDVDGAQFFDERAKILMAASHKEAPVPALRDPANVPELWVRDLVTLLPWERIAYVRGDNYERHEDQQHQHQEQEKEQQQQQEAQREQERQILQHHKHLSQPQSKHQDSRIHAQYPPQHLYLMRGETPKFVPHSPAAPTAVINAAGTSGPAPGVPRRLQASPHQLPPAPNWPPMQQPGMLPGPASMPVPPGVVQGSPVFQQQIMQGYATPPPGPNGVPVHPPPPPPEYTYGQYMPMPTMMGMPYPQPINGWMR
ncbi:hypothetical protein JA9_001440 [Meyerozyma sp. JA9]|nr:hypothetical protein JA9_001440 [Meyerozyma sp. JA9]